MVAETKLFGIIEIDDDKIINFPGGIIGFENLKKFALIFDCEKENNGISWLQSMDEPLMALPILNPIEIKKDYSPIIEDELMQQIENPSDDDILLFVSLTIPSDITKMTANLKAPFVINTSAKKAMQVAVENQDYEIKYNIYEAIQEIKEKAGE